MSPSTESALLLDPKLPAAFRDHVNELRAMQGPWANEHAINANRKLWRPATPHLVIAGDLVVTGNIVIGTGKHDSGVVIVLGNVTCKNLLVSSGFSFACVGSLTASEAIIAIAEDSTADIAGKITAQLLVSGSGAWLTAFSPKQIAIEHVSGYVMIDDDPVERDAQPDLTKLAIKGVLDDEEWRAMSADQRADENIADIVQLDEGAAEKVLLKGGSILK